MEEMMIHRYTNPTQVESTAGVFSEADYAADAGKVIAHAATTGTAIVATADGRPRVIISIPTVDLPDLDD